MQTIAFALALAASSAGVSASSTTAAPCADIAHHEFDFWVGRWDVYGPKGKLRAHSLIESVYGCGIRENWMPLGGTNGGSLSIYVPAEKSWEQFWIDGSGSRVVFRGGWNGKAMILTGVWANSPTQSDGPLTRMTYTTNADGSVRQFGEQSTDKGKTWSPAFDFLYRRSQNQ